MLRVEALTKSYGRHDVLKEVSCALDPEVRVIIGVNGSGKSTLLKIIAGIVRPDAGRILLGEREITAVPPEERRVGYVPQHPALFTHLNIIQNIRYGMRDGRGSDEFLQKLISMLALEEILEKKPAELSGGYKSRASLARSLAPQPLLMLLDEPLSDVDVAIKDKLLPEFREVLRDLRIPVLYVTHDPWEAEKIGDRFSVMVGGRIREIDSAGEAFEIIRKGEIQIA